MRAILLLGALISVSLFSACNGERERVYAEAKKCATEIIKGGDNSSQHGHASGRQQSEQSQNTNLQQSPTQAEKTESGSPEEYRVYLDATESMKGFAASPNNTFTKLIESLSYAMPGCRLYKYGMAGDRKGDTAHDSANFASEIRFSQDLRNPSFYDRNYNEDDILFNHLTQENGAVRSVFVTDGVYSARQSELQSEVIKSIDKWLKSGRFFGILVFTSPFEGNLYSENKRVWIDKVKVSDRPFYAFVFSPDEKGFRDLKEKLSGDFGVIQSLVFPRQATFCQLHPELKRGLVYKDAWPVSPFYLQMYDGSIFGDKNVAELTYDLQCLHAPDYPVTEFGLEVVLNSYTWQQNSFKKNEETPQFSYQYPAESARKPDASPTPPAPEGSPASPVVASPTPDATKLPKLKLMIQKDMGTIYSLYHLTFSLSSKALQTSIRARSTQDDSQRLDADKTYRFYEFISALATVHLQNKEAIKLPPPVFVALTNK